EQRSTPTTYTTLFRSSIGLYPVEKPSVVTGSVAFSHDFPTEQRQDAAVRFGIKSSRIENGLSRVKAGVVQSIDDGSLRPVFQQRSEEHTSELQSRFDL